MGQLNGTQEPALDIAFLFQGLGQRGPAESVEDFQVPVLLGSPVLALTSRFPVSLLSLGRALSSRKASPMGPSQDNQKAPARLLS